eukprot:6185305-Pleurochrysis_carterae.AAC.1
MAAMTTTKSASCAQPLTPNVPHRGKCNSEAIATGKMTLELAAEKFTFFSDPARQPAAAAAAVKRYQDH